MPHSVRITIICYLATLEDKNKSDRKLLDELKEEIEILETRIKEIRKEYYDVVRYFKSIGEDLI